MKTKFGRFVSGRIFPVCFYLFLIFTAVYITCRTGSAVRQLWDLHVYGVVAVLFLVLFLLRWIFQKQRFFSPLRRFWLRIEGIVLCFLFYFIFSLVCCDVVGLIVFLFCFKFNRVCRFLVYCRRYQSDSYGLRGRSCTPSENGAL